MRLITLSLGHRNLSTLLLESIYVLPYCVAYYKPIYMPIRWRMEKSALYTEKILLKIINWQYCIAYSKIAIP